ncbi:MAG: NAD(P)H-dependent glycerol-3-phosphate dehydrogenase, partial [Bdellovibrionales bacterium]
DGRFLAVSCPVILAAKGIVQKGACLLSEAVAQVLHDHPLAILSGPSFASEVARDLPTALVLACRDASVGETLVDAMGRPEFRLYLTDDIVGAQLGGALKNVLAIACGIVTGREMGDNARAALVTRGLAEMTRLGVAMGASARTLAGLSGLGDLVLTCSSLQSRNMSLGVELGRGRALADIVAGRVSVAEGLYSASAAVEMARRFQVDMPIVSAVHAIVNQGAEIGATIRELLARPVRREDV